MLKTNDIKSLMHTNTPVTKFRHGMPGKFSPGMGSPGIKLSSPNPGMGSLGIKLPSPTSGVSSAIAIETKVKHVVANNSFIVVEDISFFVNLDYGILQFGCPLNKF